MPQTSRNDRPRQKASQPTSSLCRVAGPIGRGTRTHTRGAAPVFFQIFSMFNVRSMSDEKDSYRAFSCVCVGSCGRGLHVWGSVRGWVCAERLTQNGWKTRLTKAQRRPGRFVDVGLNTAPQRRAVVQCFATIGAGRDWGKLRNRRASRTKREAAPLQSDKIKRPSRGIGASRGRFRERGIARQFEAVLDDPKDDPRDEIAEDL